MASNKVFECTDSSEHCSGQGICSEDKSDCVCDFGYITKKGSWVRCNYEQKFRSTALLFEVFLGFGFGHFYCENYLVFLGKFLFYFFSCYFNFCIMIFVGSINNSNVNNSTYLNSKRTTMVLLPLMVGWYIFDIVMFFMNYYTDNNGIDLA